MTKNRFLYKAMAGIVSAALMASMTITAGAWNEDPGESETTTAATTEATLPEMGGNAWETSTTTKEPDAVLDDDEVADEDDEDISPEDIEPEPDEPEVTEEDIIEEEPEETEAPATTTAAATAAPAPSNTAAPDSYQEVEPFEMYVPEVLNVRGGPGTEYDKLGQVYANNVISIIGMSGDWYVFDYYGADGYLLSSLLQEVPEAPAETTTTTAPETDTTLPPAEDEGEGDAEIEDDESYIEDDAPVVTTEAPEVPGETTTKETPAVAGPVTDGGSGNAGGFPPVILALICAVAAFVLIGVVPVLVHRAHHKKLYQY